MDTLKGKQIMVWTFMGNARMYEALRDYGDRISQIGLFSFKVRATGEIYESGVAISDMLTYINKWPHINWLLTVANDGANSIFRALRDNTDGAQGGSFRRSSASWRNIPGVTASTSIWSVGTAIPPIRSLRRCSAISTIP